MTPRDLFIITVNLLLTPIILLTLSLTWLLDRWEAWAERCEHSPTATWCEACRGAGRYNVLDGPQQRYVGYACQRCHGTGLVT